MLTHARIVPNKKGQPYQLLLSRHVLPALGVQIGDKVKVGVPGEGLVIRPDPEGIFTLYREAGTTPYLSLTEIFAEASRIRPLTRAALDAEVRDGALHVALWQVVSEQEARWRRSQARRQEQATMSDAGMLDLTARPGPSRCVTLTLPPALFSALEAEAGQGRLTVPAYVVHLLSTLDRTAAPSPQLSAASAAQQARVARAAGQPLDAAALLALGANPGADRAWLSARLAEGYSGARLAREFGGSAKSYQRWVKRHALGRGQEETADT
jgi:antitoxin component of MazEF toxin-antitoxin module